MTVQHIDSQPQLQTIVFREEVSQARTGGISQAIEELSEAGNVFVWWLSLDEECMSECPLCDRGRRRPDYFRLPVVMGSTLTAATGGGRVGHLPTLASVHLVGYSIGQRLGCGRSLRSRCHSLQIETSSALDEDVSEAVPHTLPQREIQLLIA